MDTNDHEISIRSYTLVVHNELYKSKFCKLSPSRKDRLKDSCFALHIKIYPGQYPGGRNGSNASLVRYK